MQVCFRSHCDHVHGHRSRYVPGEWRRRGEFAVLPCFASAEADQKRKRLRKSPRHCGNDCTGCKEVCGNRIRFCLVCESPHTAWLAAFLLLNVHNFNTLDLDNMTTPDSCVHKFSDHASSGCWRQPLGSGRRLPPLLHSRRGRPSRSESLVQRVRPKSIHRRD